MIGLTRLVTGRSSPSDRYRYGAARAGAADVDEHAYRADDEFRPVVVWNITQSCNLACQHCYYSAVLGRNPISTPYDDVVRIIDELAELGAPVVLFSGGEPMIRKDIYDIVAHTAGRGITPVVSTNGTLIKNAEVAQRLVDAGAKYVGISLDGSEQVHDTFRRRRGAYARSVEAIRLCRQAGLRVSMRFTVTADNARDLPAMLDLAEELGVARFCMYHLVPSGRGKRNGDITTAQRRAILEDLCERAEHMQTEILTVDSPADGAFIYLWAKKHRPERAEAILAALRRQGGDGTGRRIVEIDHDGVVHPNQFWLSHTIGNARRTPFRKLWARTDDPVLEGLRSEVWPLKGDCADCAFSSICGGFRARAMSMTGDRWGADPSCPLTADERRVELPTSNATNLAGAV